MRHAQLGLLFLVGLLIASITGVTDSASADPNVWTPGGPEGGNIAPLAIDPVTPTTLYAGTGAGVFKSTDGGASWRPSGTGLTFPNVTALAIDPKTLATLYAGTNGGGVCKSTDGGKTWSAVNTGLKASDLVNALAIDPVTPTTLYAGTQRGVFKSMDGGGNWTAVTSGPNNKWVHSLAIDPRTPATVYAGTEGELYKSSDSGASWSLANTGMKSYAKVLVVDPATPSTVYAGTGSGGVFKSTDGARNWTAINTGLPSSTVHPLQPSIVNALAIDPGAPIVLYVGTFDHGVFKSTDGGANWKAINTGISVSGVAALAIDPKTSGILYAGTIDGVFKTTDGGENWSGVNTGMTTAAVRAVAIDPTASGTLYASALRTVFKTTDGGGTWSAAGTGMPSDMVYALAIDPATPATLYAGTDSNGVFKSTNAGTTWSAINTGLTSECVFTLVIDPEVPSTLYAGSYDRGAFKSTDGGATWTAINAGLKASRVNTMVIERGAPATVYAGTHSGVFKSMDGGANWSLVGAGLSSVIVHALAIDPKTPSTLYAGTDRGMFKSTDGGAHWSVAGTGFPSVIAYTLAIDPNTPATIYAGTWRSGGSETGMVFRSADGGETWTAFHGGLMAALVNVVAMDPAAPTTLYAGTSGGLYKTTIGAGPGTHSTPTAGQATTAPPMSPTRTPTVTTSVLRTVIPTASRTPTLHTTATSETTTMFPFAGATLRLLDLPADFGEVPIQPDTWPVWILSAYFQELQRFSPVSLPQDAFCFLRETGAQPVEAALGFTMYPLLPAESEAVDAAIANPATLSQYLVQGTEVLADTTKFGDKSVGLTRAVGAGTSTVRTDMILIRRGPVVELILHQYIEETPPSVRINDLAGILDSRVGQVLQARPSLSTVTPLPLTPTPTPRPTRTPNAQATATAQAALATATAAAQRQIVFADGFDSNTHYWQTGASSGNWEGVRSVENSKYRWEAKANGAVSLRSYPESGAVSASDFLLTAEIQTVQMQNADVRFAAGGIYFRYADATNYYRFEITERQTFSFILVLNSRVYDILDEVDTAAIHPGQVNKITVLAQGSHFTFFVNGEYVAEADDSRVASGYSGLAVDLYSGGGAVFEFDNFELRPL